MACSEFIGAPGTIRTSDPQIRSKGKVLSERTSILHSRWSPTIALSAAEPGPSRIPDFRNPPRWLDRDGE